MTALMLERSQTEVGLAPVADFAGADPTYTDVISLKNHFRAVIRIMLGVVNTGTVKFTVNACDDVVPTNETAVDFWYRVTVAAAAPGAITRTTAAAGVTSAATASQIIEIEITQEDLIASGYAFFRLKNDEVVNDPALGAISITLYEPRFAGSTFLTATA
jgi:hypothetical protein